MDDLSIGEIELMMFAIDQAIETESIAVDFLNRELRAIETSGKPANGIDSAVLAHDQRMNQLKALKKKINKL
jgi:hypothetical protein